jgi:hypothetical protein
MLLARAVKGEEVNKGIYGRVSSLKSWPSYIKKN